MAKKKKNVKNSAPIKEAVNLDANGNIEFETSDEKYKTDGSVVIGAINENKEIVVTMAELPPQIDVAERKRAKVYEQENKKKKAKVQVDRSVKRADTIFAIIVLILGAGVAYFFYYRKNLADNKGFETKEVHVEFGEAAPLSITSYVNVDEPDEKLYKLDLSEYVPDEMGKYNYKVSYEGKTRSGVIEVSDTKAPVVELKTVTVNPGDVYSPDMFIDSCYDLNECYVTFEDGSVIKTAKDSGEISVYLIVKDKLGNHETMQAKLNVKSTDIVYSCIKESPYDYDLGYKESIKYEITFSKSYEYLSSIESTTYGYINNDDYLKFKKEHTSDSYKYNDSLSTVTRSEKYEKGFSGLKNRDIITYLEGQGYKCNQKKA